MNGGSQTSLEAFTMIQAEDNAVLDSASGMGMEKSRWMQKFWGNKVNRTLMGKVQEDVQGTFQASSLLEWGDHDALG